MDLSQYDNSAFDRGVPRWKEMAWMAVKVVFFLTAIPFPSSLKCSLLRLFGATVGEGVVIRPRVNPTFPWRLTIGSHVWIGEEVILLSLDQITIGDSVCLSQRAFICTGSHDFKSVNFALSTAPITIGRGSWIAAQAFVAPGTAVAEDTMISANETVLPAGPSKSTAE